MKTTGISRIVWSLLFALAIIASAFLLKGNPASYWVEMALTGTALSFLVLNRPVCRR